ncbi:hypothetical protein SLS62_002576 [Diatrype stigma]|uniref:Glycosyltransferase family 32 protein n=1 Tax=Diatrype stigma TaxID=117547 RepID=A0AAN9UZU5_9PEZI
MTNFEDNSGDEFVRDHFASRPDIVDNFLGIRIPIIKADLLRYLILYEHGGIWNDLDVSCEAPINEWVPEQYQAANISIVVGLEFDEDIWYRQFASWTIMARQNSPQLWTVVEDCLEGLVRTAQDHNVGIQDLTIDMLDDIVDVSGPRRLTRGIQKSLSKMLNETVGNDEISHVLEPRLIGDVLVLPDYAFANSMNQQHGDKKSGKILVKHHYASSWKNSKVENADRCETVLFVERLGRRPLFRTSTTGMLPAFTARMIASARLSETGGQPRLRDLLMHLSSLPVAYSVKVPLCTIRVKSMATFIAYGWFLETKGKAMEEIAVIFDGRGADVRVGAEASNAVAELGSVEETEEAHKVV